MISLAILMALALSPNQALIEACLNGDLAGLKQAIVQGAELEIRHGNRDLTPLMLSVYRDHPEQLQYLIQAGANINARSTGGFTPLLMAAGGGQDDLSLLLLKQGAELNARDEEGNSALHWAAYWGHIPVLKVLLAAGLDPNLKNHQDNTALLLAASASPGKMNLQRQKSPLKNFKGKVSRQSARAVDIPVVIKLFMDYQADPNLSNQAGETALMLFAAEGQRGAVHFLIASGAEADLKNKAGLKAADYALNAGFKNLSEELEIFEKKH